MAKRTAIVHPCLKNIRDVFQCGKAPFILGVWSLPSGYLNQWWRIVNWDFVNKSDWNWIYMQQFSYKTRNLKISSAKWSPFCLSLSVLSHCNLFEICGIDGKPLRTALGHCCRCLYYNECHSAQLMVSLLMNVCITGSQWVNILGMGLNILKQSAGH